MVEVNDLDKAVMRKLFVRRVIGSHHIRLTTLLRCGWKPNERGKIRGSVEKLIKAGLLVWVKISKQAIALNKERIAEIKALIEKC